MPEILTEADDFTAEVVIPEDGDERDAGSIVPAFQALTNRTRNLLGRVTAFVNGAHIWPQSQSFGGDVRIAGAIYYVNQNNELTPRERNAQIGLYSGRGAGTPGNTGSFSTLNLGPGAGELYPVHIPSGATLTRARVSGTNNSGGAGTYTVALFQQAANFIGGGGGARVQLATASAANIASGAPFVVTLNLSTVTDESYDYFLDVYGGPGCALAGLDVRYLDHGPR